MNQPTLGNGQPLFQTPAWLQNAINSVTSIVPTQEAQQQTAGRGYGGTIPAWAQQQQQPSQQQQVPAWMQTGPAPIAGRGYGGALPAWASNQFTQPAQPTTGSFLSGGNQQVRTGEDTSTPINQAYRYVRTGEGSYQAVPVQPGMLTGTFFSGGEAPKKNKKDKDILGRLPTINVAPPLGTGGGFSTTYGGRGYGGGGGGGGWGGSGWGGGGGYDNNYTPNWYLNLNGWNIKR